MKHIKNLIITTLLVFLGLVSLQAQEAKMNWAKQSGGKSSDAANAIVTDSKGNSYVTGSFKGTWQVGDKILKSNGDTDIYLAKYNPEGVLIWVKKGGGFKQRKNLISEYGTAITLVDDQFIYITGMFSMTATFEDQKITSNGRDDIMLAKYTVDGELIWVKNAGGRNQDIPYGITHDKEGNVYITGSFSVNAKFDKHSVIVQTGQDYFIAKYSPSGKVIWVRQSLSTGRAIGKSLACVDNNIYLLGEFQKELKVKEHSMLSKGSSDIFLAKYDLDGNAQWLKQIGGTSMDKAGGVVADKKGIYFTGSFYGNIQNEDKTLVSNGAADIIIGKFNTSGKQIWVDNIGGTKRDNGKAIQLNEAGEIIISGFVEGDVKFGNELLEGYGFSDAFVASYSQHGKNLWAKVFGGNSQDYATAISTYKDAVIVTGQFWRNMTLNNMNVNARGNTDVFLTKVTYTEPLEEVFEVVNELSLYPNPINEGKFTLSINLEKELDNADLKVVDIVGNTLILQSADLEIGANQIEVSVEHLPRGMYLVYFLNQINKIVIQ